MTAVDASMQEMPLPSAETEPIPPRYWWLKRIIVATGVLLVLLVVVRLWWGWAADRRLQAEIDRIIAAGEPIYPEDFDQEPVPDDQNAAKIYEAASTALVLSLDEESKIGEITSGSWATLAGAVETNGATLALARAARSLPHVDWGTPFHTPVLATLTTPPYSNLRKLARFLMSSAFSMYEGGEHCESFETIHDLLALNRAIAEHPLLISQLVAMATDNLVFGAIEKLAPRLHIDDDLNLPIGVTPAGRWNVKALIGQLQNETTPTHSLRQAFFAERMFTVDTVRGLRDGTTTRSTLYGGPAGKPWMESLLNIFESPWLAFDGLTALGAQRPLCEGTPEPTYSAARAMLTTPRESTMVDSYLHPLSGPDYTLDRFLAIHFSGVARRRLAATALAIRLFQTDNGRRPDLLEELVPGYLPQVPLDPFRDDGGTISYQPHANPCLVYSFGQNVMDDGGTCSNRVFDSPDLCFFLDAVPEPPR